MAFALQVKPFSLSYSGYDADEHTADMQQIGTSLQGTARFYNSIVNWHFVGKILRSSSQNIRVHVGPVKGGSLLYSIYLFMVHGQLPIMPELYCDVLEITFPLLARAVIAKRSGQRDMLEKAVDALKDAYDRHDDFARQVHADHVRDKAHLWGLVEKLAQENAAPLKEMSAPIGRTVRQIEHFSATMAPLIVDEPTADALTSKEEATVGDSRTYLGKVVAVDTMTGACKLLLEGDAEPVRAKITDPAVQVPSNIYTHALDTAATVEVTAKPVSKAGKLSTLYVSDAKRLPT